MTMLTILEASSIDTGVGMDDGNNASYVDISAAQTNSNPLRSPPNHADNIGRWTDEELSLYNDDNYTGDPPGEFFHCRLPEDVEVAYFDIIRPVVLRYCNEHFVTFASGLLAYGLVRTHIHNAVVVVAENLDLSHYHAIQSIIDNSSTNIPFTLKCYKGKTSTAAHDEGVERLQEFSKDPEPGSSLGVTNVDSSFSLGVYLRVSNDPNNIYALTTYHGLNLTEPAFTKETPTITIQQPSKPDYGNAIAELQNLVERYSSGPHALTPYGKQRRDNYLAELKELEAADLYFGTVIAGEMDIADMGLGGSTCLDWALVKINPARTVSQNYITYVGKTRSDRDTFKTRDMRYYVEQDGEIDLGLRVLKVGRKTGITLGNIDWIRFDVKLPWVSMRDQ